MNLTMPNKQTQIIIDELIKENVISLSSEECINECEQIFYELNEGFKLFIDDMYVTMLHVQDDGNVIGSDDDGDESDIITEDNYEYTTIKKRKK